MHPLVNWKKTKSWEWPSNEDSIIDVFLPKSWSGVSKTNINDISTAVNIWYNCKEFKVDENIIDKLRVQRNTHFHEHASTLQVSAKHKSEIFDTLRDLLRDPDVTNCLKVAQALPDILQDLKRVEDGDDNLAEKYDLDEGRWSLERDIKSYMFEQRKQTNLILKKLNQNRFISLIVLLLAAAVGVFPYLSPRIMYSFIQKQEFRKHGKH